MIEKPLNRHSRLMESINPARARARERESSSLKSPVEQLPSLLILLGSMTEIRDPICVLRIIERLDGKGARVIPRALSSQLEGKIREKNS